MSDNEYRPAVPSGPAAVRSSQGDGRSHAVIENGDGGSTGDWVDDELRRPLLSVVLPAYNEEDTVGSTVASVDSTIGEICDSYEIIVVNDGSDDSTLKQLYAVTDTVQSLRVIQNVENRGKGHAIRDGCQGATGKYVLLMDADGEFSPKQVEQFLEQAETAGADIVIGSKRHPDSDVSYPLKRHVLSKGYSLLIRGLFGLQVTDTQVGLKLLRAEAVKEVMPLLLVERYAFDVELLALLHQHGYEIAETPVSIDFNGNSSIDWREVCQIGWDTLAVFSRLKVLGSYEKIGRGVRYVQETGAMLQEK